jgi:hypothetical protein
VVCRARGARLPLFRRSQFHASAALISRSLIRPTQRHRARQTGFINLALHFEKMRDDAYQQLPTEWRW